MRSFLLAIILTFFSCNLPIKAEKAPNLELEEFSKGLSFERPIFMLPYESNFLVLVQKGLIYYVDPLKKEKKIFMDISKRVSRNGNEEGLLGMAFSPDFSKDSFFYLYYSAKSPRRSVISRFEISSKDPKLGNPDSELILMEIAQPYSNHNGGMIAFGPDKMLYISLGDGGSGGDPHNYSQNLSSLLGKMLRIDVSESNARNTYKIPKDNPFRNKRGVRPEIWAYGLRNVWRFSFDRSSKKLFAGDVGQNRIEEIDIIEKGGNYGWRFKEGNRCYKPDTGCDYKGLKAPIIEIDHSLGQSITGGYVYRGSKYPSMNGFYIYGDFISGNIWAYKNGKNRLVLKSDQLIASFAEGADAELYLLSFSGKIFKVIEKK